MTSWFDDRRFLSAERAIASLDGPFGAVPIGDAPTLRAVSMRSIQLKARPWCRFASVSNEGPCGGRGGQKLYRTAAQEFQSKVGV